MGVCVPIECSQAQVSHFITNYVGSLNKRLPTLVNIGFYINDLIFRPYTDVFVRMTLSDARHVEW